MHVAYSSTLLSPQTLFSLSGLSLVGMVNNGGTGYRIHQDRRHAFFVLHLLGVQTFLFAFCIILLQFPAWHAFYLPANIPWTWLHTIFADYVCLYPPLYMHYIFLFLFSLFETRRRQEDDRQGRRLVWVPTTSTL